MEYCPLCLFWVAISLLQFILQCVLSFSFIRRFSLHSPALLNEALLTIPLTVSRQLCLSLILSLPHYRTIYIYISVTGYFFSAFLYSAFQIQVLSFAIHFHSRPFSSFAFLFSPSRHSSSVLHLFSPLSFVSLTPILYSCPPLFLVVFVL